MRRAVCTAAAVCAAMLLTACAGEDLASGEGISNGQDAQTGQSGETVSEKAGQDEDWLARRMKRDGRTKHDLRTEPQDKEQTERIDLDAYEAGEVIITGRRLRIIRVIG